jgi:hypothetical protein
MKFLKEVTSDWKCEYRVPSHTYIIERGRLLGYIKEGTTEKLMFKKPMQFDQRRRKFEEVNAF